MRHANSTTKSSHNFQCQLDSLEQAASAIRGITCALSDDRARHDEGEEGTLNSHAYGCLLLALDTISDQVLNLCQRISDAAERDLAGAKQ